jgi:hypothetical protein
MVIKDLFVGLQGMLLRDKTLLTDGHFLEDAS